MRRARKTRRTLGDKVFLILIGGLLLVLCSFELWQGLGKAAEKCAPAGDLVIGRNGRIATFERVEVRVCADRILRVWIKDAEKQEAQMTKEQTIVELEQAREIWGNKKTATVENLSRLFKPMALVLSRCPEGMRYIVEAHLIELERRFVFAEIGR